MVIALVVVSVLCLGMLGVIGWLVADRGRAGERLSEARASRAAAEADRDAARGELASVRAGEAEAAAELKETIVAVRRELDEAKAAVSRHEREAAVLDEQRRSVEAERDRLKEKFEGMSRAVLDEQRAAFGREYVKPLKDVIDQTSQRLTELNTHVQSGSAASAALRDETGKLVRALSKPEVRGRYGEIQLRRVAELAGMVPYCDFDEQHTATGAKGNALRPDMVVSLPNGRVVAVDAKCNTYAYVEAVGAESDEERERHLERFASHVVDQVGKLSKKGYWSALDGSAEFVVMFVPGDQFLDAALARRPTLLDDAAEKGVILASPATLIGLLRAVAVGWQEHTLAERAQELFDLGRELHGRAVVAFGKVSDLGRHLERAVKSYNEAVGSIESRLTPTLKKFEDGGVQSGKQLVELKDVDVAVRGADGDSQAAV